MKLKQKYLVRLLGLLGMVATGTPAVMAADTFAGPYLALGIGQKSTTLHLTTNFPGLGIFSWDGYGDTSFFGQVAGGYTFAPGGVFRLGMGLFYDFGNGNAANISNTFVVGSSTIQEKGRYSIAVEPGIAIGKEALAYLKLTYTQARVESKQTGFGGTFSSVGSFADSRNFHGFGYGLGVKAMLSTTLYAYAEWQAVRYNSQDIADPGGLFTNTLKPKTTLGLFGMGYKF